MKKNISNGEVENLSNAPSYTFPKYTTQIINLVNGNAQGTRPDVVGQMSDLIQEFDGKSIEEIKRLGIPRIKPCVKGQASILQGIQKL